MGLSPASDGGVLGAEADTKALAVLAACVAVAVPQLFLMNALRRREAAAAVVLNRWCANGAGRTPEAMVACAMRLRPLMRYAQVVAVVLARHVRAALRRTRTLCGAHRGPTAGIRRVKQLRERAEGGDKQGGNRLGSGYGVMWGG